MLKQTVTYTDFNDTERTEDFYFNLTKLELTEMNLSEEGGLQKAIERIVEAKDIKGTFEMFKKIMLKAYGEKSEDGKRFIKNETLADEFSQTAAFSNLIMELISDEEKAAAFITGILPSDLKGPIEKELAKK